MIDFVNAMLASEGKEWSIDKSFVEAMNARQPTYLPPLFRYGSQAGLNAYLRGTITKKEKEEYLEKHPNPTVKEIMNGTSPLDANFRMPLTDREMLNQFGVRSWKDMDIDQQVKFNSGATAFRLKELHELPAETPDDLRIGFAKKYIEMVKELKLPTAAGISGTLDQSTTMAGLVGIGVGDHKEKELEQIKLSYLAFMVPNTDHSVHEIMQSTKTFGLDYIPGPGFETYIYPSGGASFIKQLTEAQAKRNYQLPSYYLSREHAEKIAEQQKNYRKI